MVMIRSFHSSGFLNMDTGVVFLLFFFSLETRLQNRFGKVIGVHTLWLRVYGAEKRQQLRFIAFDLIIIITIIGMLILLWTVWYLEIQSICVEKVYIQMKLWENWYSFENTSSIQNVNINTVAEQYNMNVTDHTPYQSIGYFTWITRPNSSARFVAIWRNWLQPNKYISLLFLMQSSVVTRLSDCWILNIKRIDQFKKINRQKSVSSTHS